MSNSKVIDNIIKATKKLVGQDREYIRIVEYSTFFFVSYDDYSEPLIFDKHGIYTGKVFSEFSREDKRNRKEVYYEE